MYYGRCTSGVDMTEENSMIYKPKVLFIDAAGVV